MIKSDIWVERFRPSHVKNVVMPETYRKFFCGLVEAGECQNILLYSSMPGTGKTSLAKALVNDLGADSKYINISAQRGIDVLRDEITAFATTKSVFTAGKKIVICDEFDGATPALQQALRAAIEAYEKNCRFILTCNYYEKIIPALREGRLNVFDFNFGNKEFVAELKPKMAERVKGILSTMNVEYDPEAVDTIVDKNYPSLRKMISIVSKTAKMYGKVTMENISTSESLREELYALIEDKNWSGAREFIIKNSLDVGDLFSQLYTEWASKKPVAVQARLIPHLNDFQSLHNSVPDQELNMAACLLSLIGDLG